MIRAFLLALAAVAACQPPGSAAHDTPPHAPTVKQLTVFDLVGGWRWVYRTEEQGTTRIEDEDWRLRPDPSGDMRLVGRYLRTVEVRSKDLLPFQCNQRPWYRQRTLYDVVLELGGNGLAIRETGYQAEPSPCDHGFRHMSDYQAVAHGNRMTLHWEKGEQTLWQVDDAIGELPEPPWKSEQTPEPTGSWRWQATSYDDDGNIRDEAEWWEITRRTDTKLDATYRRRVTVHSADGKVIACANAPSWSFDDAYVLSGQKEEEHWHFYELGVEPGDHPCTRVTPKRTTDEATAEQIGDYLVLEWRGKRRQILYRPDAE